MKIPDVVLPRRVVPQPQPAIVQYGDCGACVLAGLLGLGVDEAYERLRAGKRDSIDHYQMKDALHVARAEGLCDRIVLESPHWQIDGYDIVGAWGAQSTLQSLEWATYLQLAFDAGYYALARVDSKKRGPWGGGPDHWVMLCGIREVRTPIAHHPGSATIDTEILVSCSARSTPDEEWVCVQEFLRDRGGFNCLLARPVVR